MKEYQNKLGNLADKLKKDPPKTPIQEVNPVKSESVDKEAEAQLNVWIPKSLLKLMKGYGLEHDLSLNRYYGNVDQAIPWQTDQSKNWRNGAANAVEALLQS